MRLRFRFFVACFALGAFLMAATPAYATQACGPSGCKQIDPPDPLSGGGTCDPSDACCNCKANCEGAYERAMQSCALIPDPIMRADCKAEAKYQKDVCINGRCAESCNDL